MVNVAGRSKGCTPCRKRRVKCDETRPICQRCEKLGFACDGPKSLVFIEGKIVKSRRSQKPSNSTGDTTGSRHAATWKRQDMEESLSLSPARQLFINNERPKLNEYEVYVCYLRRHLYPNGPIDLGLQGLQMSDLTPSRSSKGAREATLFNQTAMSYATLLFGAHHYQNRILAEGYNMHGVALRQLNQALSLPGCHARDDVLVSVIIMAMLELHMPSGPKNWLKHMSGLEQLLQLRDPGSLIYASYRTLELYKGVRHFILIASLRNRTPSIFAQPRWKAVLRTALSLETPEEQDLQDVLADCSVLISASDELSGMNDACGWTCSEESLAILDRALGLRTFLRTWKKRWDADEGNAHVAVDDLDAFEAGAPSALWTTYRFRIDSLARLFMLYNTALIYVLQVIASSELYLHQDPRDDAATAQSRTENTHTSIRAAGLEIARSITGYLQHRRMRGETDFISPIVQWAVITAWQALGGTETEEGRWMMKSLAGNSSYTIAMAAWQV